MRSIFSNRYWMLFFFLLFYSNAGEGVSTAPNGTEPISDRRMLGNFRRLAYPQHVFFSDEHTILGTFHIPDTSEGVLARWAVAERGRFPRLTGLVETGRMRLRTNRAEFPNPILDSAGKYVTIRDFYSDEELAGRTGDAPVQIPVFSVDWENSKLREIQKLPIRWADKVQFYSTSGTASEIAFLPGSNTLLVTTEEGPMNLWDWRQGKLQAQIEDGFARVVHRFCETPSFSAVSNRMALLAFENEHDLDRDAKIMVWDMGQRKKIASLKSPDGEMLKSVELSQDGRICAAGSDHGHVKVFDVEKQTFLGKLGFTRQYRVAYALSPDSKHIVWASSYNRKVLIHIGRIDREAGTVEEVSDFDSEQSEEIVSIAFAPSGKSFITIGDSSTASIKRWKF